MTIRLYLLELETEGLTDRQADGIHKHFSTMVESVKMTITFIAKKCRKKYYTDIMI